MTALLHGYQPLEDNRFRQSSWQKRRAGIICCVALSIGIICGLREIAVGDSPALPFTNLVNIIHGRGVAGMKQAVRDHSSAMDRRHVQPASSWHLPKQAHQFGHLATIWPSTQRLGARQDMKPAAVAVDVAEPELKTAASEPEVKTAASAHERLPPGLAEDPHFQLDESVAVWKDFQRNGAAPAIENFREALSIASSIADQGPEGLVYALAHGVRTGYFTANAALGTIGSLVRDQIQGTGGGEPLIQPSADRDGQIQGLGWDMGLQVISNLMLETAMAFKQDYRQMNGGMYKPPWDMYTLGHRQQSPQFLAQQTGLIIEEMMGIMGRAGRGGRPEDIGVWLESPLYPDYYKNNFHYQTDGWMASGSAKVYETSTETIFMGRQDAMQRLSLIPLRDVATANKGAPRILEVSAGTGRFATFIRDNHPTALMTISDLSPFYLETARENDEYWREMRYPSAQTRPPPAKFVQTAAEALPFEDGSFDAVVCVYLFHEMPEAERAAAALEMARVVAPGGIVVLTDSQQLGDRPSLDGKIANFAKLNEPHYQNYISTYLPALFSAGGLIPEGKWVLSSTKCLSFRKPANFGVNKK